MPPRAISALRLAASNTPSSARIASLRDRPKSIQTDGKRAASCNTCRKKQGTRRAPAISETLCGCDEHEGEQRSISLRYHVPATWGHHPCRPHGVPARPGCSDALHSTLLNLQRCLLHAPHTLRSAFPSYTRLLGAFSASRLRCCTPTSPCSLA